MNGPPARRGGIRRWLGWLDHAGAALLVVIAGFVIGQQYVSPNKRVIPVLAALLLFGLVWRVDMATGIGVLTLALPFPRFTTFGNTNLAFVLLLLVVWLLRVTTRQSLPPTRTPIDIPLVALLICYVVSFFNVPPGDMGLNLSAFAVMAACWLMFYIIASNLRTESDFQRVLVFQAISALTVCLVALYEVTHPGVSMLQLLAAQVHTTTAETSLATIRAGSVFFDYELLCEYCALNLLLVLFLFVRAGSLLPRLAFGGLLLFLVFVLFTTVTRGGVVSLILGVIYLTWLIRRRITFVGVAIAVAVVVAGAFAMNTYVASSTHAGNLFDRLFSSEIKGLVPDTRAQVWPAAWERIFQHPLIGHGPSYASLNRAVVYYWPHSLYLYVANNVGFIGLAVFLWLLGTLFWMTRPVTDDLRGKDFAASYLLVAHVQMVVFIIDEVKIEYLRNPIYQFEVWLMFGLMAAAGVTVRSRRTAAGRSGAALRGR